MVGKQCKCGDDIVNDFCTEEQILSGCVNVSPNILSNKKKIFKLYNGYIQMYPLL